MLYNNIYYVKTVLHMNLNKLWSKPSYQKGISLTDYH